MESSPDRPAAEVPPVGGQHVTAAPDYPATPPPPIPPPPPAPPTSPWGGYQPWWQPPVEQPRKTRAPRIVIAAMVALALVSASIGAVIGAALGNRSTAQNSSLQQVVPTPGTGSQPGAGATVPQNIPAQVDPSIVDINTQMASQTGGGSAAGTGMILTAGGVVLTNNHVIDGATSITAQVDGTGTVYTATVVGYDRTHDIAVLQLAKASGLHPITPGNSSKLAVGDNVVALGNALGQGGTPAVAPGQITALNQTITASDSGGGNPETLNGLIEMNAKIQPGDSGGPLVNAAGQVIGMNTAGSFSRSRGAATGDGFAIPINSGLSIAQQIESGQGSSSIQIGQRGIMGVGVADSTSPAGAVIKSVDPSSPAAGAGLVVGDVIVSVNGSSVGSSAALSTALTGQHAGDSVNLGWVDTSGQNHTAKIQLIAGPPN